MCGIIITNRSIDNFEKLEKYIIYRGPDKTGKFVKNGITFLHYLLNITGDVTKQPFMDQDEQVILLYNGEIYNYKEFGEYSSDGLALLPLYKKYSLDFVHMLDGEFAIVLIDFKKRLLICCTDVFGTKPLFFSKNNKDFGISSYKSCLTSISFTSIKKLLPNRCIIYNLDTLTVLKEKELFKFDLKQFKINYNDWNKAFEQAVLKRIDHLKYKPFVCLSSGYDSGAICTVLNKYNIPYDTYTIIANENEEIIKQRNKLNKAQYKTVFDLDQKIFNNQKKELKERCEQYEYISQKGSVLTDKASTGMAYIFKDAGKKKKRIYLSGQGADEIISDYGFNGIKIYKHSQFGGLFPDDLKSIFPWNSFYSGTQEDYLMKEELVAGAYSVEGRYPFLDPQLVQQFLWLTPELKNKMYKAPIANYLIKNNYPFEESVKIGFQANKFKKQNS